MINSLCIEEKINYIIEEIKAICYGRNIVIAFSGGLDSTVASRLAIQAMGREKVEAISVNFGDYSYRRGLNNIRIISNEMGLKLKILSGKHIQEKVLRKGPACNQCTKIAKLGLVKEKAGNRLVLTGSNQSDTWGKMGVKLCDGFYAPLMAMSKVEINGIARYFNLNILKIGENKFREGCKLKHLLKPLAAPHYHGQAAALANEVLLKTVKDAHHHAILANIKIIGPLRKNIGLVNVLPLPDKALKSKISNNLKKIKTLEKFDILERPIKLIIKANKGQFNHQHSRYWLEKGRLQPDFSVPIRIEWLLTTNKNLSTFQVVDYEIIG